MIVVADIDGICVAGFYASDSLIQRLLDSV